MYSVPQYLKRLKLAKRSPVTLTIYAGVLDRFARFIGVPVDELHTHLEADQLINYAETLGGESDRGTRNV